MDTQLDGVITGCFSVKSKAANPRNKWTSGLQIEGSFKCKVCQAHVHTIPELSGVQNRNHCPYCLWSRHLDLWRSGDRLSACKAMMEPIGLTMKPSRNKFTMAKFGYAQTGELMLIHRCSECGAVSINRIAADDSPEDLVILLDVPSCLEAGTIRQVQSTGIQLLKAEDIRLVKGLLFGYGQL